MRGLSCGWNALEQPGFGANPRETALEEWEWRNVQVPADHTVPSIFGGHEVYRDGIRIGHTALGNCGGKEPRCISDSHMPVGSIGLQDRVPRSSDKNTDPLLIVADRQATPGAEGIAPPSQPLRHGDPDSGSSSPQPSESHPTWVPEPTHGPLALKGQTPDVPARLSWRYSLLELSLALCWHAPRSDDSLRLLRERVGNVDWPEHLGARLREGLTDPLSGSHLSFNPHFSPQQRNAITALLVLATRWDSGSGRIESVLRTWMVTYHISDEELACIDSVLTRTSLHLDPPDILTALWSPPDVLERMACGLTVRLSLDAHRVASIAEIHPSQYEHPRDRESLSAMKGFVGFDTLVKAFSKLTLERLQRVHSQADRIQVTPRQFPELYELWLECLDRCALDEEPLLYIESGSMNAYTCGIDEKQVVLSAQLIRFLDPQELMFVLGHELGHIRSKHVLYGMMAQALPSMLHAAGQVTLGISNLVGQGLHLAVLDWFRKAELTSDRYGLLVCQDLDVAERVLMKLAGAPLVLYGKMNWRAFVEQGRVSEKDMGRVNRAFRFLMLADQTHPWPAVRAYELNEWVSNGEPIRLGVPITISRQVTGRSLTDRGGDTAGCQCAACGALIHADDSFCSECGARACDVAADHLVPGNPSS